MSRIVNYDFSESDKQIIASRLLGDHYSQCAGDEQGRCCGYISNTLCEVKFFSFMVSVFRYETKKGVSRKKWANILYRKLLQDNTLDFEKDGKQEFNRYAYVDVDYDSTAVDFIFRYKPMEDAV